MLTEILAIYAAVISTVSLAIAYFAYRSGDPKLSGSAELIGSYVIDGPVLRIALHNRGRGAITVDSGELLGWAIVDEFSQSEFPLPLGTWKLNAADLKLPIRIDGHSGIRWNIAAHDISERWLKDDFARLEVEMSLATGETLTLAVKTWMIDVEKQEKSKGQGSTA